MSHAEQPFPLDTTTLLLLRASCEINEDTGQTHLNDFLHMGSQEKSREDISDEFEGEGAPVYFVEYEDGAAPFSPHDAIKALVDEVLRLRSGGDPE